MRPLILAILILLAACGTDRDTQTRTVERVESQTGPLVVDTPFGQFVAQPVKHVMLRSEDTVEHEEKRAVLPDAGPIMAAASIIPGLGPAAGILGLLTGAAAAWKALQFKRQRNQLIDGIETGRDELPDDADARFKAKLAAAQDADLQKIVRERTA
jgi:hypothetical protein